MAATRLIAMHIQKNRSLQQCIKDRTDYTFCTRLCENESNLKVIQSVMSHSDIQTTMDIYAECTAEKKQEVFVTLNGKIMIK